MNFVIMILIFAGAVQGTLKNPEVTISDGKIEGIYSKSYNGKIYMAFLGIPYAEPPIGKLRFQDSEPIAPWKGTTVVNQTSTCLQILPSSALIGDEDCLHINVYVPGSKIDCTANLDVVVFIHGGAYVYGSSDSGGPKFLMDRKVILVTFNYRVGVLGFLSTGDEMMPGNYGMKDQVLAMKWVRKNIASFGGNELSVTLHGHSAGGSSVHYHYLSPLSRGLFERGMSSSGSALNPWAFDCCPLEKAKIIAKALNCSTYNTYTVADCLQKQSGKALTSATRSLRSWLFVPIATVSVVIDDSSSNPFLPKHPYEIMLDKDVYDVPWISSHLTSEGIYNAKDFWQSRKNMEELDHNWGLHAPDVLHYRDVVAASDIDQVSLRIKNFYLRNGKLEETTFLDFLRLLTDRFFVTGIGISENLHAKAVNSPVRSYIYDYISDKKPPLYDLYSNISRIKLGPGHGDDVMLMYSTNGVPLGKMSRCDEEMKDFLIDLITAYAKYGHPKIRNWQPVCQYGSNYISHLYIGRNQEIRLKISNNLGERQFWEKLPLQENIKFVII